VLDAKGKTGCIEVVFNGIDSNTLRLNQLSLSAQTPTTPTAAITPAQLNVSLPPTHRTSASLNDPHTTFNSLTAQNSAPMGGASSNPAVGFSTSDPALNSVHHMPTPHPAMPSSASSALNENAGGAASTSYTNDAANNSASIIAYLSQGLLPG
jgi:hypothetical protein